MGELVRDKDWSQTSLGPISGWPASLRIAVSAVLDSPLPMIVLWGDGLNQIYNDAYQPLLGARHPAALGQRTQECWPEVWHFNEPIYRRVIDAGERAYFKDQEFVIEPSGVQESHFFTITYSPSRDESGVICGITVLAIETTQQMLTERANHELLNQAQFATARHAFQLRLSDGLRHLDEPDQIIATANESLGRHLDVSRVMYAEVDESEGSFVVRRDWTRNGLFSMAGEVRRLDDFGPEIIASLRAGDAMVIDDIVLDPRTAGHADAYSRIEVRSNLAIPLVKAGRMIAILSLQNEEPRHWSAQDIEISRDMAERAWASVENAKAQADLRTERDKSQHIFDGMTEGFAILDRRWTVLQMNAEGLRIGQRAASEVIGRKHWDVWPETTGTEIERFYRRVMKTRMVSGIEHCHFFSSDQSVWLEIRAYPTLDGGLAIFFRDISARKQIEQQLKDADRRKDEFLAMLAHELRNPLAPISAAAQLLSLVKLDEAVLKKTSEIIGRQVKHMTSLVDDLLDVSRVSRGLVELEKIPLYIDGIVADAVEQVSPLMLSRRHQLALQLPGEAVVVMGDKKRLVQVIANLLTNAAKYTLEGGNILLKLEVQEGNVMLDVQDDGIGMGPELAARVFDLFTQAERTSDRSAGGLGLGLSLVKSLTELHGGKATCFSEGIGKGSRFTVCLPRLLNQDGELDSAAMGSAFAPAHKSLKVMIVDDNIDAALMLSLFLEALGYSAIVEHGSRRALERARIEKPDVCLLDIGLPEMDGNELAQRLRAQPESAKAVLIAVTGYGQEGDRKTSRAAGFGHHMVKPVDTAELAGLLASIEESS